MAKQVLIIEDRPTYAGTLKEALNDALTEGALENDDVIHSVRAHEDVHSSPSQISNRPHYYLCSSFQELKDTINEIKGDQLLLLDVDLVGVHGYEGAGFTESPEIPSFYASLTNQPSVRTTILLYSEGLRPERKAEQIIKYGGRPDYIASLLNSPVNPKEANIIVKGGLNLFFNHPLEQVAVRLKLDAFHGGHCSEEDFKSWFEAVNSDGMYPAGTLQWLTSDWLRKRLER